MKKFKVTAGALIGTEIVAENKTEAAKKLKALRDAQVVPAEAADLDNGVVV